MLARRFLFFLVCCSMPAVCSFAQSAKFRHLTIDNGLSQNSIQDIVQDPFGFIWVATQDGLNRYDGYNFRIFKNDPQDTNSIAFNTQKCIYVDPDSSIWIGGRGRGIDRFDPRTNRFTHYYFPIPAKKEDDRFVVSCIIEDQSGHLYVSTSTDGIFILNKKEKTWKHLQYNEHDANSLSHNNVQNIAFDKKGILWCATWGGGVVSLDPKTNKFRRYTNLNSLKTRSLYPDKNGKIWISAWVAGINLLDPETGKIESSKDTSVLGKHLPYGLVWGFMEDKKGQLWIGTAENGVICYNTITHAKSIYKNDPNDPFSVSDNLVWTLFEDRSGLIWCGTWQSGINIYDPQKQKMEHYYYSPNEPQSLINNTVWSISAGKGNKTWYATSSGACLFDPSLHSFTRLQYNNAKDAPAEQTIIQSVLEDTDGQIWLGTNGAGAFRHNPETGSWKHYRYNMTDNTGLSGESVNGFMLDKKGRLWIVIGGGGLNLFNRETDKFSYYIKEENQAGSLSSNSVTSILERPDGKFWVATGDSGLDLFDPLTARVINFQHHPNKAGSLPSNNVISMYIDRNNILWLGTAGGLCCLLEAKKEFIVFTEKDGLPNNLINSVKGDDNGNLWLSTNKGLCLFNPTSRKVRAYDVNDGIQSNEFNQNAGCQTPDGYIHFGGVKGMNRFHPRYLSDNPQPPTVVLTGFSVLNKPYTLESDILYSDHITLHHKDYFFSFEFAGLEYTNSARNRYQYMLKGFNDGWIDNGTNRLVTFTNLDPGEYTLYLKACNSDGVWSASTAGIHLTITPPFWKTKLFYAFCLGLIILLVYSYIKYRERQLRNEKIFLENKVEERTRELSQEKAKVEEKQKEILDSIRYAKRIQQSLLTTEKYIDKNLKRLLKR